MACGSGAASVAVTTGTPSGFSSIASSPTAVLVLDSNTFTATLQGAATVYIGLLNPFLTTSSATATYLQISSATATYLQLSSATATYLTLSSATATYFLNSSILAVAHGGTGTSSPGLIAGTNMGTFTGTWPNVTINGLSTLVNSTASITSGHCAQFSGATNIIDAGANCGTGSGGGGGGASSLAVNQNAIQITSPTAAINILSPPLSVTSIGAGTTAQITLLASSVTLQGQNVIDLTSSLQSGATFFVSSATINDNFTFPSTNNSQLIKFGHSTLPIDSGIGPQTVDSFIFNQQHVDSGDTGHFALVASTNPYSSFVNNTSPFSMGSAITLTAPAPSNGGGNITFGFPNGSATAFTPQSFILGSGTSLVFDDNSTNSIQFVSSQTVTTTKFVLPNKDGTNGQALITDGSHNLSFGTVSGSGGGLVSLSTGIITPAVFLTSVTVISSSGTSITYGVIAGSITASSATLGGTVNIGTDGSVGIGIVNTHGAGTLEANNLIYGNDGFQALNLGFVGGYFLQNNAAAPGLLMADSAGGSPGTVENDANGSWDLGYTGSDTSLGTPVLLWNKSPWVDVKSSMTVEGPVGLNVKYNVNAGSMTGAGLTSCSSASNALTWNSGTSLFGCNTISGSGGGPSVLAVQQNTTNISSPTVAINFLAPPFTVSLVNGSTSQVGLQPISLSTQIVTPAVIVTSLTVTSSSGTDITYGVIVGSLTTTGGNIVSSGNITVEYGNTINLQNAANSGNSTIQNTGVGNGQITITTGGGSSGGLIVASSASVDGQLTGTTFVFNGPSPSTVTFGLTVGTMTLNGSGNATVTENGISGQVVLSTAGATVTPGDCAYFSSSMTLVDAGAKCGSGGGGSGTVGSASINDVAYYTGATTVGGSGKFNWNGTSVTVIGSSVSITSNGSPNIADKGFLDVVSLSGSNIADFGSTGQTDQVFFPDQATANFARYGVQAGAIVAGASGFGTTLYSNNTSVTQDINIDNSGEMDLQTALVSSGGGNIVLKPNTVSEVTVSSFGVVLSTALAVNASSMTINNINYTWPSSQSSNFLKNNGSGVLAWAAASGGGSGIVSPATFTWVNNFGMQVSTLQLINAITSPTLSVSTSATGVSQLAVSSIPAVAPTDFLFTVSSAAGTGIFLVQNNGHIISSGTTPSMGTCGTTPSVIGTDNAGTITVGGGVVTSCTMNFAYTWGQVPVCVESDNSTTITGDISAISTSAITFSFSATLGGGQIYYVCYGVKG